jgi:hypothetical protein
MTDIALARPTVAPLTVPLPTVVQATVGFLVLGLAAGVGSGDAGMTVRTLPSGLVIGAGAAMLTAPGLVVAHQFLKLRAAPGALVAALTSAYVRCGKLALGLAPAMLFFASTTELWALFAGLAAVLIGSMAFGGCYSLLRRVERDAGADVMQRATMDMLVLAWCGLTGLIGVRISWDAAQFVFGGAL